MPTISGGSPASTSVSPSAPTAPAPTTTAAPPGMPPAAAPPPASADVFEPTGGASAPSALVRGGLPELLLDVAGARVVHGTDPGDFYCEHMFFRTQAHAVAPGASVLKNEHGEPLVGFLHVPWDRHTSQAPPDDSTPASYTQAERHGALAKVIGAALCGYAEERARAAQGPGEVRLLLSGYGPFSSARNNPTGEFVSHVENIDRAMAHGFGGRLLTASAELLASDAPPDGGVELRYRVLDKDGGLERSVLVRLACFAVADAAIDGVSDTSVQKIMDAFGPHGVLALGVAWGRDFRAEFHADDGGLKDPFGAASHDDRLAPRVSLKDNFALARAIHRGGQRPSVPLSALLVGGAPPV